jgi:hypothetical protein
MKRNSLLFLYESGPKLLPRPEMRPTVLAQKRVPHARPLRRPGPRNSSASGPLKGSSQSSPSKFIRQSYGNCARPKPMLVQGEPWCPPFHTLFTPALIRVKIADAKMMPPPRAHRWVDVPPLSGFSTVRYPLGDVDSSRRLILNPHGGDDSRSVVAIPVGAGAH